jgi:hypothetical protein
LDWTKARAENARKETGRKASREPEVSDERLVLGLRLFPQRAG